MLRGRGGLSSAGGGAAITCGGARGGSDGAAAGVDGVAGACSGGACSGGACSGGSDGACSGGAWSAGGCSGGTSSGGGSNHDRPSSATARAPEPVSNETVITRTCVCLMVAKHRRSTKDEPRRYRVGPAGSHEHQCATASDQRAERVRSDEAAKPTARTASATITRSANRHERGSTTGRCRCPGTGT